MSQHDLGEITRRLQAVEQDAAAARVLAGAADRGVSEIRFNALRQDFVDLRTHQRLIDEQNR